VTAAAGNFEPAGARLKNFFLSKWEALQGCTGGMLCTVAGVRFAPLAVGNWDPRAGHARHAARIREREKPDVRSLQDGNKACAAWGEPVDVAPY